jgi:hypothetical protein
MARHHEAVAWRWRAARSCWAACFLIELRCAVGQSTQHHRFRFASAVVSGSARGADAPRTGAGEVHRQCFASVGQCAGAQIWPRLAGASCWISRRLRLGLDAVVFVAVVALARYGHPLRFYITPHCPQCPPVAALKLRLVPVTASRPSGEGNRRYAKWPSLESVAQPSALPGRLLALRAAVCAPLWMSWHLGIGQALRAVCLVSGLRPVILCVPRPPCGLAAARLWPCAGLPVRPQGAPSAQRLGGFCYIFSSCSRTEYGGYRPNGL